MRVRERREQQEVTDDMEEWCGGCVIRTWPRQPLPPLPEL